MTSNLKQKKEGDLIRSYETPPPLISTTNLNINGQHKNDTNNFDYTTITHRLRTVSLSNNSHETGVVKPGYGY